MACAENPCEHPQDRPRDSIQDNTAADGLTRLSVLVALQFALRLSVATFAEDKPADKPAAAEGKKKAQKQHDPKKAEGDATKEGAGFQDFSLPAEFASIMHSGWHYFWN